MNKPTPTISIICALAENRAIGKNNQLLWYISDDLKHFKKITEGHPVIMGKNTFESIGHPLPKRTNIIITRDPNYQAEGCRIVHSIDQAIKDASEIDKNEIFFIGGGEIYSQAMPLADKLYLTLIKGNFSADTFFPDYSEYKNIKKIGEGKYKNYEYQFLELTR